VLVPEAKMPSFSSALNTKDYDKIMCLSFGKLSIVFHFFSISVNRNSKEGGSSRCA
jgi:hypothetical protein